MADESSSAQSEDLQVAVQHLNARAWGITGGLLLGGGLFVATLVLVIKGGPTVGRHLTLLSNFFPGYRVTVLGSFIGFVYAFVIGYGAGRVVGSVYNKMVR